MKLFLLCVLAYLLGSIPFGVLIGKCKGTDIREQGSGNIGAANAVRTLGWFAGVCVLLGDALKSIAALAAASFILGPTCSPVALVAVGICAILGHNASVFLRFHGGKGVATTLGVFLVLSWKATVSAFSAWLVVAALSGYASLASLTASCLLPVFMKLFGEPAAYVGFSAAAFLFIVFKHRKNIERLLRGEENKLLRRGSSQGGVKS